MHHLLALALSCPLSPLYEASRDGFAEIVVAAQLDPTTAIFSRSGFLVSNGRSPPWQLACAAMNQTHLEVTKGFAEIGAFDHACNIQWTNGAVWYAVPPLLPEEGEPAGPLRGSGDLELDYGQEALYEEWSYGGGYYGWVEWLAELLPPATR